MDDKLIRLLRELADKYETPDFLGDDPSFHMHQIRGKKNMEAMAFVASSLSFGARSQFMPKIKCLRELSKGRMHEWILSGAFESAFPDDPHRCFYRFFTFAHMRSFLAVYRNLLEEYGSLGEYVRHNCHGDGFEAARSICRYFADRGPVAPIPQDAHSACKRLCMFLRWMVRSGSPVDLGLWADFIDRKSLVMPLDTHVLKQARRLGLMKSSTASMSAARKLSAVLAEAFPDDPLRGDFALFGLGVNARENVPSPSA